MSHRPCRSLTEAAKAAISFDFIRSREQTSALPPSASISRSVSIKWLVLRPTSHTIAPSTARRLLIALPMPRPAPVTIAICPLNNAMGSSIKIRLLPSRWLVCLSRRSPLPTASSQGVHPKSGPSFTGGSAGRFRVALVIVSRWFL